MGEEVLPVPGRKTRVRDVITQLQAIAPEEHALAWDKVGLQLGDPGKACVRVLTALELTDAVVDEAARRKADLLVLHHPVIFDPLTNVREDSAAGKRVVRLIRASAAVYVMHTNFDASPHSMTAEMLRRLGAAKAERAAPKPNAGRVKIAVFCPKDHTDRVRTAMGAKGAGVIGEYELCSFSAPGTGTFRGSEAASPFVGEAGRFERAEEDRLEMICPQARFTDVITAMVRAHPYEEPAYDIYPLRDFLADEHFIWTGELDEALRLDELAARVSERVARGGAVFVAGKRRGRIRRVAAASGGGKSLLRAVAALGTDCFITGEIGHHGARWVEGAGFPVIAGGHYETEVMFGEIVARLLRARLPELQIRAARSLRAPFRTLRAEA